MKQQADPERSNPALVLVVDDDPGICRLFNMLLEEAGYRVETAEDAHSAQVKLGSNCFDAVISDIVMPGLSGIDLLKKQNLSAPDIPFILVTGNPDLQTASEAVRTGSAVDYLTKPVSTAQLIRSVARAVEIKRVRDENRRLTAENLRYQLHLEDMVQEKSAELVRACREIRESYDFSLEALVAMLDAREQTTARHSVRVRECALILARKMEVSKPELHDIALGTLLHDIGKIALPDAILLKPDSLTEPEWTVMRTHPQIGYDIIKSSAYLAGAALLVLSHHEKYDGSGYPRGLAGNKICLGARIFAVVDAYDAMRSTRIYKPATSAEEALEEIRRCRGSHFDPAVVDIFLSCRKALEEIAAWDTLETAQA
jgi:response regulator RpfG family c-di-GMP phosphodiesterase